MRLVVALPARIDGWGGLTVADVAKKTVERLAVVYQVDESPSAAAGGIWSFADR